MRRVCTLVLFLILVATTDTTLVGQTTITSLSRSLNFTANQGQWPEHVAFQAASGGGVVLWFTAEQAVYQFTRCSECDVIDEAIRSDQRQHARETMHITANFVGANPVPQISGEDPQSGKCNYFIGNDPSNWHTDVPNYSAVNYRDIYEGIDLKYFGNGQQLEYDFIVAPGADPNQIAIRYKGVRSLDVNSEGELVVTTDWGTVIERQPEIYQESNGKRTRVEGRFRLIEESTFGFELAGKYSQMLALVIDPVLTFSTYLGGGGDDRATSVATDGSGDVYVAGWTSSADFPALNQFQNNQGGDDAFVSKFNGSNGSLVYSTYIGGGGSDEAFGLCVDSAGNAFVTGTTGSGDFPTANPFQTAQGHLDIFVTKLSSTGNSLVYSTYVGGTEKEDEGFGIAVDTAGSVYVTGDSRSIDFPVQNAVQESLSAARDAVVFKLTPAGNALMFSTYLGGTSDDEGTGIAMHDGSAFVTGYANSDNFPLVNAYQSTRTGNEVFVARFSPNGNALLYSTFIGGGGQDRATGIAVDFSGSAYIVGWTSSTDFPTKSPFQTDSDGLVFDGFVTKVGASGDSLVYSTYLGGINEDRLYSVDVDGLGRAVVTGVSRAADYPVVNQYQTFQGGIQDAVLTILNAAGNDADFSTYLGGSSNESASGVALDGNGTIIVVGWTDSPNFPTSAQYQSDQAGRDAFVTKFPDYNFCSDMLFRPSTDGWRFNNSAASNWPPYYWWQFDYSQPPYPPSWRNTCKSSDYPDWPSFVSAFGDSQCFFDPPVNKIYKPSAVAFWFAHKGEYMGACYGMSVTSLLFFDDYLNLSGLCPGCLNLHQIQSGPDTRRMIAKYFMYQFAAGHWDNIVWGYNRVTPNQTLAECQAMLESNLSDHRFLHIYPTPNNPFGGGGHSLNPYKCEVDQVNPDLTHIYVYDCNYPGVDTFRVTVNVATNTWSSSAVPYYYWGHNKRFFLSDPMSSFTDHAIIPNSFQTKGVQSDLTGRTDSQYVRICFGNADNVTFRNSTDSVGFASGVLFSTMDDGMPMIPLTLEKALPFGYYLPKRAWSIQLSGFADSSLLLTAFMDSTIFSYHRSIVDSTQSAKLICDGGSHSFFITNPDSINQTHDLQVIEVHPDSEVVILVQGISCQERDSIDYSVSDNSELRIDNYGPSSAYDIRVEIASSSSDTVFYHQNVPIDGNTSHIIRPDWRQYRDSLHVLVDHDMTGAFNDSLVLLNQGEVTYDCGDADGSGVVTISDAVRLINYIFSGGPAPNPLASGDADCSGAVTISDAVYLINFIFGGGAAPCAACP